MSKNFIRQNIEHIRGTRKPPSYLEDEYKSRLSVPKTNKKYENIVSQYKPPNINIRVMEIQKKIEEIQRNRTQSMIINQISEIKDDLRMIKSHLFQMKKPSGFFNHDRQKTHQSGGGQDQNIYLTVGNRLKSQGSQKSFKQGHSKVTFLNNQKQSAYKLTLNQVLQQHEKQHINSKKGVSIKSIYPMLKDYKLQGPQFGTIFYGYSKRNSQPVAIKYIASTQQTNQMIEIYDRLWKNIAKAKWPCVNRIYDYKLEDNNFIIMEKNRATIAKLPYKLVILDIFKSLEFIHQCGYLYRNIQPEHFMLNQQGQMTLIDFQRTKRYVDIKGHQLQVTDNNFNGSAFASNNQVRGHHEGRKDDLESLGYFALLLMEHDIPWYGLNKEQTIKLRSTLTLQELFHGHQSWIQYMAIVMRTNKNERPDYIKLQQILQRI